MMIFSMLNCKGYLKSPRGEVAKGVMCSNLDVVSELLFEF